MKVRLAIATLMTAGAALALPATAAHAVTCASGTVQGDYGCPSTQVVGTGGTVEPAVQAVTTAAPSGTSLPLTGGDVAGMTLIGIALLGGGTVLVRRTRRKPADTQN